MSAPFSLTNSAATRIAKILVGEPEGTKLRVAVGGGGCSGFQYKVDFDCNPVTEDDLVIEHNGSAVIIDSTSLEMLKGSELDYVETLGSAGFEIRNPNATAKCGCGNSFSV